MLRIGMHGEDNHFDLRRFLSQNLRRVDAVQIGHGDVHQHHLGLDGKNPVQRRAPVGGFPHHLNTSVQFQQCAQALA